MKKYFGNLGKKDFLYSYGTRDGQIFIYSYRIISKKDIVKIGKFGKKETLCEFTVHLFRYMDKITKYEDYFNKERIEVVTLHASNEIEYPNNKYQYGALAWYADIKHLVNHMGNHIHYQDRIQHDNTKVYEFYQKFANGEKLDNSLWRRTYIGAFTKNERGNSPKLVTWSQLKDMFLNQKLDYPIEQILDWNQCHYCGFKKFQYDPYTGTQVDWGKISEELSEFLHKQIHV